MEALILLSPFILIFSIFMWAMVASSIGAQQRSNILDNIRDSGLPPERRLDLLNSYDLDTFDAHIWRVMTFRDPSVLYIKDIAPLIHKNVKPKS